MIGIGLVVTHLTREQLAPLLHDAASASEGKPFPLGAAAGAILARAVWIDLDGDHRRASKHFLPRVLPDFAAKLVGHPAVHPPRFACPLGLDLAQALKEQNAAGILRADLGDPVRNLVGGVLVGAPDMPPEILITVLPLDGLAALPLLLGDLLEVAVARLVQAVIGQKDHFQYLFILPDGDHREILDVEIDADGDQMRVQLALDHAGGFDLFGLREMQRCLLATQDQGRALLLPVLLLPALLKVARAADGVVHPDPPAPIIDLEADKAVVDLGLCELQVEGSLVKGRVIGGPWKPRFAFLLAAFPPGRQGSEVGASLANRLLHGCAPGVDGHAWKAGLKVPSLERMGMLCGRDGTFLEPTAQFVGRDQPLAHLLMLLGVVGHLFRELLVVREQEIEKEGAGLGEDGRGLHQGIPFLGISSSTRASGEIQLEDGTACRFAHGVPALSSSWHRSDDESQNCSRPSRSGVHSGLFLKPVYLF